MEVVNVNLETVDDGRELHPEGPLHVRVVSCEERETSDGSGTHLNWRLDPVDSENHKPLFLITSLKPHALWKLKGFLKACQFQWNSDGTFDFTDVLGSELIVNVQHETYNNDIQDKPGMPYKAVA